MRDAGLRGEFWARRRVVTKGPFGAGFRVAYLTFVGPLVNTDFFVRTAQNIPVLISGWINVAFLATVAIGWRSGNGPAFRILRTTTLVMIPFCWSVFGHEHLYPREGHILWIASMAGALFSVRVFEPFENNRPSPI
jgi:hypothetical protein